MVNKCSMYGCKSGYDSQDATGLRITFHSFPQDEELRAKWIRANPQKDFTPTNNSRMCSLRFAEIDFVEQHCDSNQSRYRSFNSPQLQRRYMKKDAVPSIFNDAPSYLSSPVSPAACIISAANPDKPGAMFFHPFQCCSHFRSLDTICWSLFNSSRYHMIPFVLFIHQFLH